MVEGRWITWGNEMDLCADAIYMNVRGKLRTRSFRGSRGPQRPGAVRFLSDCQSGNETCFESRPVRS
jgi:hypothetical protein